MATTIRLRQVKETPAQPLLLALDLGLKTWQREHEKVGGRLTIGA
jgi:hypothetical protein